MRARLFIRIDVNDGPSFGPGKARLLELIDEYGSVAGAAAAMQMSYRHAWLMVDAAEITFATRLVTRTTGGRNGGGAKLTDEGRDVLARYRDLERKATEATDSLLGELVGMQVPLGS